MQQELRKTGIDVIGDAPWGSHFCQFYETKQDLLDILVPYFKAGLENNEFCMWVTAAPLYTRDAIKAMRAAMPDFDSYLKNKQIEVVPHERWHDIDGVFDKDRALAGWVDKLNYASAHGFDGLRLTGNNTWPKRKDRADFKAYEAAVDGVIGKYKMLALCTYRLENCTASDVLDVMNNHEFTVIRREGEWQIIGSNSYRQAKDALAASERRYRQLIETTSEGVWVAGTDGRTIYVNQRMADMLGLPAEELMKSRRDDFFDPEYYERAMAIRKQREEGISGQYELKLRRKDGSPLWVLVSGSPVYDEDGKHTANLGMHKDITDMKLAEEKLVEYRDHLEELVRDRTMELAESEEKYRTIIETANEGIWSFTPEGNVLTVNGKMTELLGYTREEIIGRNTLDFMTPELKERTLANRERIKRGEKTLNEFSFRRKDGSIVWTIGSATGIYNDRGEHILNVAMHTGITERKKAEEALRESEEKFRTLVENAPVGIGITSADGGPTMRNIASARMLGYDTVEELYQAPGEKTFADVTDRKRLFDLAEKGLAKNIEILRKRKDSSLIWVSHTAVPLKPGSNEQLVITVDITDRKRAEEALKASEEKFRALFENSPIGISITTDSGRVIERNATIAAMYGYSSTVEFMDSKTEHYYNTSDRQRYLDLVKKGPVNDFEVQRRRKDGSLFWASFSSVPFRTGSAETQHITTTLDITARKKAEEALRESEERFRTLVENAPVGIAISTSSGRNFSRNRAVAAMLGYASVEEMSGIPADALYADPVDRIKLLELAEKGLAKNIEIRRKRKDGLPVWVSHTIVPLKPGSEELIVITVDVDQRKRAEEELAKYREHLEDMVGQRTAELEKANLDLIKEIAERLDVEETLRESEERYRQLIETASEGIWVVDTKGVTTYVNQRLADSLGYSREELIGRMRTDFIYPEDVPALIRLREARRKGVSSRYESRFIRKDGALLWMLVSGSPIFDTAGKHTGNLGMHLDITESKQAEEALRASEEKYRSIIETANEGITMSDLSGRVIFVNERFADMLGYKPEEMVGRSPLEYTAPEFQAVFAEQQNDRELGISDSWEMKLRRKKGDDIWVISSGTPLYNIEKTHYANLAMVTDITDRKQAEEALRKLNDELEIRVKERTAELEKANDELRLRSTLLDATSDAVFLRRPDGVIVYANESASRIYGYTRSEFLTQNYSALIAPEELALYERRQPGRSESGEFKGESVHLRKDASRMPVEVYSNPIVTEKGDYVWSIVSDITRRKLAEERLNYLASFPELNPTPVLELDEEGNLTYVNPAMKDVFPDFERLGLLHPYLAGFDSLREIVRGSDKPFLREVRIGEMWYEQVFDYLPETKRFRIYGRDISIRKKALEELRQTSLYARSLIEASLDPLVTINVDGKITDANKATETITGANRNTLIGNDFSDYFTEPEKAEEGYQRVFAGGFVRDYPLTVRSVSGKTTDVLYNATVYRDEEGEVQGVFAAARDITRLKQLENELRRSNSDLQQFAYITSHDLQEPLRMITSYLQLIERRYKNKLDADADEFIGYAVDGATRMRTMITDLLEYSRIETRGKPLQPTSTEAVLAAAESNLEVAIKENAAVVTHDHLPAVKADATQLTMLFQNLVGNGIKFHGKEAPRVHVSAREEGNEWRFAVSDNGIGIEPQYFGRLFQIFQRLHTRDEYPGTGIGLALCKRIVERHGGRIWVESEAGRGATFYFTIPIEGK